MTFEILFKLKEDVKKLKQDIDDAANLNVISERSNSPGDQIFEPNSLPSLTSDQPFSPADGSNPSPPPSPTRSTRDRQSSPSLPDLSPASFEQPMFEPAKRRNIQIQPRQKRRREIPTETPSIDGDDMQSEYACSLVILDDDAPQKSKRRKSKRIEAMKYQLRKVEERQGLEWYCFEVRFHIDCTFRINIILLICFLYQGINMKT